MVLTGAGISAESGIRTFRGSDGLWEEHRIEEVATPQAFARHPALVYRFYNERRQQLLSDTVQPNAAHHALARLEREYKGTVNIVTQNVDNLHERAGSHKLIHMHGELLKSRCVSCGDVAAGVVTLDQHDQCRVCNHRGVLRPHIVWFGEVPFQMEEIAELLAHCTLFISIGTSGNVYPAAGFAKIAAESGARTLELNLEASSTPGNFDEARYGPAGTIVPLVVDELTGSS